ncbi:MAG TPA: glycosyltransferase [Gemmatimonadaceae bacterium]|nr:glycosyltransferase [Gemmatimonadaceae bacterium]
MVLVVVAWVLIVAPFALAMYAYVLYPALLRLLAMGRSMPPAPGDPASWPFISITVPAYNEERAIRATIENLLACDYPADRREILVVSDASTDGTDAIVREYADRGVNLLRLSQRGGKTAAENAAGAAVRADIVINTDASVRVKHDSLKPLVRMFADSTVGVASGRDVSVGDVAAESSAGESGYVGYEMGLRALETRVGSIIGASGCFYAFRRSVYDTQFPDALSRDFASVLIAREQGYRSVSVDAAVCYVPRTVSLEAEFRRKIRTMARGLATLWYKRALLNPFRYGAFSFMLASHKLARWLVYAALPFAGIGLILLATTGPVGVGILVVGILGVGVGMLGMRWREAPRLVRTAGFAFASALAGMIAWKDALARRRRPIWEPTRRPA